MKPCRVVFDTNTVISALLFPNGSLAWLRQFWSRQQVTPLVNSGTVQELCCVLAYPKFKLTHAEREHLLGNYLPFSEIVESAETNHDLPKCRDFKDQMFLELADTAKADVLVTGDSDLLSITSALDFVILSPANFQIWLSSPTLPEVHEQSASYY